MLAEQDGEWGRLLEGNGLEVGGRDGGWLGRRRLLVKVGLIALAAFELLCGLKEQRFQAAETGFLDNQCLVQQNAKMNMHLSVRRS